MRNTDNISRIIRRLHLPASAALDGRVYAAISQAAGQRAPASDSKPEPTVGELLGMLMKKKSTQYTIATVLGLTFLAAVFLNHATTTAWAMEQAIEAVRKYKALHLRGHTAARDGSAPSEVWARANASGTRSERCLAKLGDVTVWVKDSKTYTYDPTCPKIFVEPGVTAGLNPWFGPRFLSTLSKMRDYRAVEGSDPATGQKRVIVTGSLESAIGPQSFLVEFDAHTKLPVSITGWHNLKRHGAPGFVFDKIVYFEDLPDSAFRFDAPGGLPVDDKPLTIPEANIEALSDPNSGIQADGLTREEACRKLLEQFWTAYIKDDMPRLHRLCPLTTTWPDALLRDVAMEDEVVEVLEIRGIELEGQSKLGPLALVPSRARCRDGKVRDMRMVVQFRNLGQHVSCVVHGPHGYSVDVD